MVTTKQSKDFLNEESIAKLPQKDSLRRGICLKQAAIHLRAPQTLQIRRNTTKNTPLSIIKNFCKKTSH